MVPNGTAPAHMEDIVDINSCPIFASGPLELYLSHQARTLFFIFVDHFTHFRLGYFFEMARNKLANILIGLNIHLVLTMP